MEKIVITRQVETVIDQPNVALENLQQELKNIKAQRENLDRLEAEILENIQVITEHTKGYVVNVTEGGTKAVVHKAGSKWVELDVHRGDKVFTSKDEAERYANTIEPREEEVEPVDEETK